MDSYLNDLIRRLETCHGPDRNIDADIHEACGRGRVSIILEVWPPHYTSSIDSALTLLPKLDGKNRALWWKLEQSGGTHGSGKFIYHARINMFAAPDNESPAWATHDHPAIALVIAILKARQSLSGERAS